MHDCMEMADVVGRKLVENDQKRILHWLFEGVTSNLYLDNQKSSLVSPDCSEMVQSQEEVIPCCSNYIEDNKRDRGSVAQIGMKSGGLIWPDDLNTVTFGRSPLIYFDSTNLHSDKELGLKISDSVTYILQSANGDACRSYLFEAKDVQLIDDNG